MIIFQRGFIMIHKSFWLLLVLFFWFNSFTTQLQAEEGIKKFDFPGFRLTAVQDTFIPLSADLYQGGDLKIRDGFAVNGIFNLTVNVFLIQKEGRNILIDAGNGGASGRFLSSFPALGIKQEDIDAVLITHFHSDHIGGLIDRSGRPSFSKAVVYLSEAEWEACLKRKYKKNSLESNILNGYQNRIKTFQYDQKLIAGFIARKGNGHTVGHVCYELENYQFLGDLMHISSLQFPYPNFCAVFDYDKKEAVKMRVKFISEAWNKKTTLIGAHFPFPGIGHVEKKDGLFLFIPDK